MTKQLLIEPKDIAGRQDLRNSPDIKTFEQTYKIRYDKIQTRPGFQERTVWGDLEGLSVSIAEIGLEEPITVLVLKDGTIYLVDGERRFKAIGLLIKQGHTGFEFIPAYIKSQKTTEAEMMRTMYLKNNGTKQFEQFEEGNFFKKYLSMPYDNGKSRKPSDIARELGVSKMHVSNRLALATLTQYEKQAILDQIISSTALKELKSKGQTEAEIKDIIDTARVEKTKIKVKDTKPEPAVLDTADFSEEKQAFKEQELPQSPTPEPIEPPVLGPIKPDDPDEVFDDKNNAEADHQEKNNDTDNFMAKKGGSSSLSTIIAETSIMLKAITKIIRNFPLPAEDETAVENLRFKMEINLKNAKKMADAINS